ncbi:DUF4835 family protein [Natronogracilivirgula saccharolytica]|uniref:DUF4835 family protein n=2 Tax=Natronogracilivirga saccharolytica TaxID=2812953 RepID=A0A8J7RKK0_9BACT|nr:DUF4835 family protein [Natronogracilivirga saccharolytica]
MMPAQALAQQVFNVSVDLNTSQISTTDHEYIYDLEPMIKEYLENNRWTEDRFEDVERINVNIQVVINSVEDRNFSATLLVSTERPIFNTLQVTPVLVITDNNWSFEFGSSTNLLHDTYQYDPIASVLDFYANIILGFDYDTFSELGGQDYFRNARRISDLGESSGSGWTASGSRRSRSDLVAQMLNPNYEDFRTALYLYHRKGLDLFTQSPDESRDNILEAFDLIQQSQRRTSARHVFELLFAAKHREFRAIFMEADTERRLEAYNILTTIDDSRISEYERLQR